MTATAAHYEILPLADVPARVLGVRQELNHLWYGPSEVLVARAPGAPEDQVAGAVRLAMRERPVKPHGLIADLVVERELRETGLPEQLLAAAEERLKQRGAEKLDAVTVDGQGWAPYYFRRGFWSSRRMVVLTWDLTARSAVERSADFRIERVDRPDPDAAARFIVNSYQPYFRWWKEAREDQKWDRVELQEEESVDKYQQAADEIRRRAVDLVAASGRDCPQTYFLAYQGDTLVGLCDAKDAPEGQDTFDWCVLVSRSFTGKALGSTLLDHALEWLAQRGRKTAEYVATSGLDDYDPLIYLSTVVTGAQIRGEFLNLVKNRLT